MQFGILYNKILCPTERMEACLYIPTWNNHQDMVLSEKSEMQNDGMEC